MMPSLERALGSRGEVRSLSVCCVFYMSAQAILRVMQANLYDSVLSSKMASESKQIDEDLYSRQVGHSSVVVGTQIFRRSLSLPPSLAALCSCS